MPWSRLGEPRPPEWRGRPPQMLSQDVPVWHSWLERAEPRIENIYYNVALTTNEAPAGFNEGVVNNWLYSVSKRIDALVVWKDKSLTIVEVCQKAGLRAVGQAVSYKYLWNVLKPLPGENNSLIVCIYADADVKAVAAHHNITITEI